MFNFAGTSFAGAFATGFEAVLTTGLAAAFTSDRTACLSAGLETGLEADLEADLETDLEADVTFAGAFVPATGLLSTFVLTLALAPALDAAAGAAVFAPTLTPALTTCVIGAAALPFAATPFDACFAAAPPFGAGADVTFLAFFAVTDFFDDAMTGHSCLVPGWSRDGGGSDTQLPFRAERRTSGDPTPCGGELGDEMRDSSIGSKLSCSTAMTGDNRPGVGKFASNACQLKLGREGQDCGRLDC